MSGIYHTKMAPHYEFRELISTFGRELYSLLCQWWVLSLVEWEQDQCIQ